MRSTALIASFAAVGGLVASMASMGLTASPASGADDELHAEIRVVDPDRDSVAPPLLSNGMAPKLAEPYGNVEISSDDPAIADPEGFLRGDYDQPKPLRPGDVPESEIPGRTENAAAEISYPRANYGDCDANPGQRTFVSRFSECNDTAIEITVFRGTNPPVPVGFIHATVQNITDGYLNGRVVYQQTKITNITQTGSVSDFTLRMTYMAQPQLGPPTGIIRCTSGRTFLRTRDEWTVVPTANTQWSGVEYSSYGTDQIQHCAYNLRFDATVIVSGQPTATGFVYVLPGVAICDTANYIYYGGVHYTSGCRLDAAATFVLKRSDPFVNDSAQHITDALADPDKNIPDTLTRLYHDTARRDANRAVALAACKAADPSPPSGYQCDEYPFASSYQGAALGDGNFSSRYIDGPDNSTSGGRLGNFYAYNRVIDSELAANHEFKVRIDP